MQKNTVTAVRGVCRLGACRVLCFCCVIGNLGSCLSPMSGHAPWCLSFQQQHEARGQAHSMVCSVRLFNAKVLFCFKTGRPAQGSSGEDGMVTADFRTAQNNIVVVDVMKSWLHRY